jgi:hypothetical protein
LECKKMSKVRYFNVYTPFCVKKWWWQWTSHVVWRGGGGRRMLWYGGHLTSERAVGRHKTLSSRNGTEDWMKLVWWLADRKISAKLC